MKIILALDHHDPKQIKSWLEDFQNHLEWVKVGLELYHAHPEILEVIKKYNYKIFLDLKLHDIPETVFKSLKVLTKKPVDMVNVHALGGQEMLMRAREATPPQIKLIGVTVLTSLDDKALAKSHVFSKPRMDLVHELATHCSQASLDGIVCSPHDLKILKPLNLQTVCPGIRLPASDHHDQKMVITPIEAKNLGVDYAVMGRPITAANNPLETLLKIKAELK
jgi:orotidine-5'-phosphate decarboxylase